MPSVADCLRQHGDAFVKQLCVPLSWQQQRVLSALSRCRTGELGYTVFECQACGDSRAYSPRVDRMVLLPHFEFWKRNGQINFGFWSLIGLIPFSITSLAWTGLFGQLINGVCFLHPLKT